MSSSAQPTVPVPTFLPNFTELVTAQLIGSLLSFFFFGILLIQVYIYRVCFPKDSLGVKFFVYFIFLAMTVCTCLIAADDVFWFGADFGNVARFADARNSRFYNPLMGSFIGMLVQLFFSYRIVAIRRAAWPLALLTSLIALAQCAGGMGAGITSYMDANAVHDSTRTIFACLWIIGSATVNIFIAGTMTCLLLAVAEPPKGRDIVKSAVRMIIETNIFTAVVALLGLLLFFASLNTNYWACPMMILPGVYANTLLVTLNNRAVQRIVSESIDASTTIAFSSSGAGPRASGASTANSKAPLARSGTVYSTSGLGRVLSVPAMSFTRREDAQSVHDKSVEEKHPRSSVERQWRGGDDADSESEYTSDGEAEAQV